MGLMFSTRRNLKKKKENILDKEDIKPDGLQKKEKSTRKKKEKGVN